MTFRPLSSARASLFLVPLTLTGLLLGSGVRADAPSTRNEAIVGGILIHRVRTTWAGLSPEQRADKVQQRLNIALGQGAIHAKDITVGQADGDWCVLFRGRRFLTADPLTAHENHAAPKALANVWAKHLQQVLPDLTRAKGK